MATIVKLPSGNWRAQFRYHGKSVSKTFRLKSLAERWATEQHGRADRGETPTTRDSVKTDTVGQLIQTHLDDMAEVGKAAQRSKEHALLRLQDDRDVGKVRLAHFTRERVIEFGRRRAKEGAGPSTLSGDLGFIKTVFEHASAVYGHKVPTDDLRLARIALMRLGLVGSSVERDRRPTQDELNRLLAFFRFRPRTLIPMERIIKFAVATAMRQEEITRILFDDFNDEAATVLIRQRKHPRAKATNDQVIPLVADTGFDAVALIKEQREWASSQGAIFPYCSRSMGAAFRRACLELQIEDLHFHDLRHEGISRLFEADWDIPQVASVSGHKDWKMLQRYTHLRPSYIASRSKQRRTAGPGT
ncbi:site-specific integrase [Hyphomicrobium sp.]|uniref:site-specific integrase n=1 Tax=Hyphomicrobium sp. TaxID=82 RepID=UPI002FDF206D